MPGQNAADSSSRDKAHGTHPSRVAGWVKPQASTETLWLKLSGNFSFYVALKSRCRRHSGGQGCCSWLCRWTVCWVFWSLHLPPSPLQHHRGGEGVCAHSRYSRTSMSPHLSNPVLSPAHPWPFMGHWCKWGLNLPQRRWICRDFSVVNILFGLLWVRGGFFSLKGIRMENKKVKKPWIFTFLKWRHRHSRT